MPVSVCEFDVGGPIDNYVSGWGHSDHGVSCILARGGGGSEVPVLPNMEGGLCLAFLVASVNMLHEEGRRTPHPARFSVTSHLWFQSPVLPTSNLCIPQQLPVLSTTHSSRFHLQDPDRFVRPDPEMAATLLDQKEAGKMLLLITNRCPAQAVGALCVCLSHAGFEVGKCPL
jgi:hypothetical protein